MPTNQFGFTVQLTLPCGVPHISTVLKLYKKSYGEGPPPTSPSNIALLVPLRV